jgi:2,4-dienoyl-CoA reductase-like NADH-dependent reductase (Old Yellow Enzyme family)
MSVKNRLVKAATYEAMAAANGSVTDQLIVYVHIPGKRWRGADNHL